jgi:hypothetical protein
MMASEQHFFLLRTNEIAVRGKEIYDTELREHHDTPQNLGGFLAIDVDSGDYEVGGRLGASEALRERRPNVAIYLMKIGYPAAFTLAGRLLPLQR